MRNCLILLGVASLAVAAHGLADDFGSPGWKDEAARGYLPYRKLTVDEFPANDHSGSPHLMHTEGFLHYTYKATWTISNGKAAAKISELTVRSGYDRNKSWRRGTREQDEAILAHEQGHLDISELHGADFRNLQPRPVGQGSTGDQAMKDLESKLKASFDRILKESQDEQDKYDAETNHGMMASEQKSWELALKKRRTAAGILYWDQSKPDR